MTEASSFDDQPDTQLTPDGEVDLNAIRDRARADGPSGMTLAEALEKMGHHGLHFVNPDAHPDQDYSNVPSTDAIKAAAARARAAQATQADIPPTDPQQPA